MVWRLSVELLDCLMMSLVLVINTQVGFLTCLFGLYHMSGDFLVTYLVLFVSSYIDLCLS